jgi:hypothetical protein
MVFAVVVLFCLFYGFAFALFAPFLILFFLIPPAILALMVIWALPDLHSPPTGALSWLEFAFMFMLVIWPSYIAVALPGLPWITMVRITGFPLAIVLMVCASTSATFRGEIGLALKQTPVLWRLLVAFVVIQLVSIGFSRSVFSSFDKFLVAQISWTAIYFASVYVFLKPGRVERMSALIWGMAMVVGLIGIAEWRVHHVLWAGHIPSFLQINDRAVAQSLASSDRAGAYRSKSTFENPLGFGEYMALATPFVMRFAVGPYNVLTRVAAAVSVAFIMFATWTSHSRCGTIGVPLGVLFYGAAWAALKWRRDRYSMLGPALALGYPVAAGLVLAIVMFVGRIRSVFVGNGSENSSTQDRYEQISMGVPKVLSHPWGYGIGQGAEVLGFAPYGSLTIDNYYLDVLLEYGVIGFIVYYGMLLVAFFYAGKTVFDHKRLAREAEFLLPIAVAILVFFLIKSSFSEQNNHPLIFMMMGMVSALVYRVHVESKAAAAAQSAAAAAPPVRVPPRVTGRPAYR